MSRRLLITWLGFCVLGVIFSGLALANHYGNESSFCTLGDKLNCDLVNRSVYSDIAGIPVALIGLVGYLVLLGGGWWYAQRPGRDRWHMLLLATSAGLLFSFYLTGIEIWRLGIFCPLCLGSQLSILTLALLAAGARPRPASQSHPLTPQP